MSVLLSDLTAIGQRLEISGGLFFLTMRLPSLAAAGLAGVLSANVWLLLVVGLLGLVSLGTGRALAA